MGKILSIAKNTFRESIRDRIFYSLVLFALGLIALSIVLGALTISRPIKIIQDFGLGSISIIGTLIVIFVGIGMVHREMERRTIHTILSKPVHRWQFLAGKYFGLCLTLLVEVAAMSFLVLLLCYWYVPEVQFGLFYAIIPIFFKLALILAFAFLFSSFSSVFLSGMFTLSIFVIGHFTRDLKMLGQGADSIVLQKFSAGLFYFLPNLEALNYKTEVVHHLPISLAEVLFSIVYATAYTAVVLLIGIFIFNHRDIT